MHAFDYTEAMSLLFNIDIYKCFSTVTCEVTLLDMFSVVGADWVDLAQNGWQQIDRRFPLGNKPLRITGLA